MTQLDITVTVLISVTSTIQTLKSQLQQKQGFPFDRIELLYRDQPLENQRHVFDYYLSDESKVFALLHILYDKPVKVRLL